MSADCRRGDPNRQGRLVLLEHQSFLGYSIFHLIGCSRTATFAVITRRALYVQMHLERDVETLWRFMESQRNSPSSEINFALRMLKYANQKGVYDNWPKHVNPRLMEIYNTRDNNDEIAWWSLRWWQFLAWGRVSGSILASIFKALIHRVPSRAVLRVSIGSPFALFCQTDRLAALQKEKFLYNISHPANQILRLPYRK